MNKIAFGDFPSCPDWVIMFAEMWLHVPKEERKTILFTSGIKILKYCKMY